MQPHLKLVGYRLTQSSVIFVEEVTLRTHIAGNVLRLNSIRWRANATAGCNASLATNLDTMPENQYAQRVMASDRESHTQTTKPQTWVVSLRKSHWKYQRSAQNPWPTLCPCYDSTGLSDDKSLEALG